jgi:hypothetical protein
MAPGPLHWLDIFGRGGECTEGCEGGDIPPEWNWSRTVVYYKILTTGSHDVFFGKLLLYRTMNNAYSNEKFIFHDLRIGPIFHIRTFGPAGEWKPRMVVPAS